jgi:hypothetical protein
MAETLYGVWWIDVTFGETQSGERFTIAGSDSSDGVYDKRQIVAGITTVPALISGPAWSITMEFSPFGFLGIGQVGPFIIGNWYPSGIVRSATYTEKDYLVVTLGADYPTHPDYAARPDHDQPGLVLTCRSLAPSLRPPQPVINPLNFTLPRETIARFYREHKPPSNLGNAQDSGRQIF